MEIDEKDIDWDKCYISAFIGGNIDIIEYCEEKLDYRFTTFELEEDEIDSTLEGWKALMLRAAKEGDLDMLMYCELMIEEEYQCILGLINYEIKTYHGYVLIKRNEDDFYEKDISISQGSVEDLMNPLPSVMFKGSFSTVFNYKSVDLIVNGKEKNKAKMIEFLKEVLSSTQSDRITGYLEHNLDF